MVDEQSPEMDEPSDTPAIARNTWPLVLALGVGLAAGFALGNSQSPPFRWDETQLGTVSEWFTAVATAGALLGIIVALRSEANRAAELQTSRDRAQVEASRREAVAERRRQTEQAARVWVAANAYLTTNRGNPKRAITIANTSEEPIYDVEYVRYDGDNLVVQRENVDFTLLPGVTTRDINEPEVPNPGNLRVHFEIYFTDRRGRRWRRNGQGHVRLISDENAVDELVLDRVDP